MKGAAGTLSGTVIRSASFVFATGGGSAAGPSAGMSAAATIVFSNSEVGSGAGSLRVVDTKDLRFYGLGAPTAANSEMHTALEDAVAFSAPQGKRVKTMVLNNRRRNVGISLGDVVVTDVTEEARYGFGLTPGRTLRRLLTRLVEADKATLSEAAATSSGGAAPGSGSGRDASVAATIPSGQAAVAVKSALASATAFLIGRQSLLPPPPPKSTAAARARASQPPSDPPVRFSRQSLVPTMHNPFTARGQAAAGRKQVAPAPARPPPQSLLRKASTGAIARLSPRSGFAAGAAPSSSERGEAATEPRVQAGSGTLVLETQEGERFEVPEWKLFLLPRRKEQIAVVRRFDIRSAISSRFIYGAVSTICLAYTFLAATAMEPLVCIRMSNGSYRLKAATSIVCYTEEHRSNLPGVIVAVVFYVLSVPVAMVWILLAGRRKQLLQTPAWEYKFGSLTLPFVASSYWFALVDLLRKLALIVIVQFLGNDGSTSGSLGQLMAGFVVFTAFALTQVFVSPYNLHWNNRLSLLASVSLLFFMFAGLLYSNPLLEAAEARTLELVGMFILGLCAVVTVVAIVTEYRRAVVRVKLLRALGLNRYQLAAMEREVVTRLLPQSGRDLLTQMLQRPDTDKDAFLSDCFVLTHMLPEEGLRALREGAAGGEDAGNLGDTSPTAGAPNVSASPVHAHRIASDHGQQPVRRLLNPLQHAATRERPGPASATAVPPSSAGAAEPAAFGVAGGGAAARETSVKPPLGPKPSWLPQAALAGAGLHLATGDAAPAAAQTLDPAASPALAAPSPKAGVFAAAVDPLSLQTPRPSTLPAPPIVPKPRRVSQAPAAPWQLKPAELLRAKLGSREEDEGESSRGGAGATRPVRPGTSAPSSAARKTKSVAAFSPAATSFLLQRQQQRAREAARAAEGWDSSDGGEGAGPRPGAGRDVSPSAAREAPAAAFSAAVEMPQDTRLLWTGQRMEAVLVTQNPLLLQELLQ
jgi:hypothetical protein